VLPPACVARREAAVRIARVLRLVEGEPSPFPVLALERDGAVYDVGELDRAFGTPFAPERLPGAEDFHTRAVALRCAGLDTLDERLRAGDRPSSARLLPGTFAWLPPCDTERALYVQVRGEGDGGERPSYRIGNARGLLGSGAAVPFPAEVERPCYGLGIAAVLGEDLEDAGPEDAERAILGYALLNAWRGAGGEGVPVQLGPVLVTADEVGDVGQLRAQVRVEGSAVVLSDVGLSPAASIAEACRSGPLRAGDVIGAGCVRGAADGVAVAYGAAVELGVERLGRLVGRAVRRGARTRARG
jgi:Fumarylacetoacetate (FAA) hydrolase family